MKCTMNSIPSSFSFFINRVGVSCSIIAIGIMSSCNLQKLNVGTDKAISTEEKTHIATTTAGTALSPIFSHLIENKILSEVDDVFVLTKAHLVCKRWAKYISEMPKKHRIDIQTEKLARPQLHFVDKAPFPLDSLIINDRFSDGGIGRDTLNFLLLARRIKYVDIITKHPIDLNLIFKSTRVNLLQEEVLKRIRLLDQQNASAMQGSMAHAMSHMPLYYAVVVKAADELKPMIEKAENVNEEDRDHRTAMHYAAFVGAEPAVKLLIEKGAKTDGNANFFQETPIALAVRNGHLPVVELLLGNSTPEAINWALAYAAENGHLSIVKCLLTSDKVTTQTINRTLETAAENGHLLIVEYLLALDSTTPEAIDWALTVTIANSNMPIVEQLLTSDKAKPETIDWAFVAAARNGHLPIVERLLALDKVTPEAIDRALEIATENSHQPIIALLKERMEAL
eukprot:gene285-372_t